MRRSEIIGLASVAVIALGALGAGRHVAGELERVAADDARARLAAVGFTDLAIAADGLVLEASGRLRSEREREIALTALREGPDVAGVVDNIVVVEPLADLRPAILRIQKDESGLTLTGEAPNAEARDLLASRAALAVAGADFLNLMKAQDRRASEVWLAAAEAAIDAVAALRVGQASVERGILRIEGAAADAAARDDVVAALQRRLGDRLTLELDITSPPPFVSPFEFVLAKTRGGLDLRLCHAPSAAARSTILGAVRTAGGERAAAGGCVVANGAPNDRWSDAVARAIEALGPLVEGEVRLRDDRAEVLGFVDKGADIAAAIETASANWPELYGVSAQIREILPVIRPFAMTIVKRPGDARLTGAAPSLERAERWAERLDATNALDLARGAPAGWTDAVDALVETIAGQKLATASITDRAILLTTPVDASERAQLAETLRRTLPDGFRIDVVEAREPTFLGAGETATALAGGAGADAAGYRFAARRGVDGAVTLAGVVEDPAARTVVGAYARAQLGGEAMDSTLSIADAEPPAGWKRAVFASLEALAQLGSGDVSAEPGAIYLRGTVEDAAALREALAVLASKSPPEYTAFSRVTIAEYGLGAAREDEPERRVRDLEPEACIARLNQQSASSPILFESGRTEVGPDSDATLDVLAELLQRCPTAAVEIGGHTDSLGSDDVNLELSRKRAASVSAALVERGVVADRLTSEGYGEAQPVASNDAEDGRALNRRIEFKLLD